MILTAEQEQIRDTLRTFAREQLAPNAAEWDKHATFPREALRQLGELGVCGMVVPDEWGGSGLDYVSLALAMEEIAVGDGATSTIIGVQNSVVCGPINNFGTEAHKKKFLRLVASEIAMSAAVSPIVSNGNDGVLREILTSLRRLAGTGHRVLLCFDDAHLLSEESLLHVVLPLLNLAESEDKALLAIVLVGQPVLSAKLRRLHQISERIAVTTALTGFTVSETSDYVRSSLLQSGGRSDLFSSEALQRLFEITAGNPRRINRLCDMALLVGYAEQLGQITASQIDAVSSELMPAAA